MKKGPCIGVALGSGSARGLAHIGALMALEENHINIDMIAGSSSGALVGGLYLCGISPSRLGSIALQIDRKFWIDLTIPKRGFIKGEKIEEILGLLTRYRNIEELDKPFVAVATDLKKARRYVFDHGPVYKAIRASISVPGVFVPVKMNDMILVDGAVTDRVPASLLKEMGCDIVIAIDVGFGMEQGRINHVIDVILQSIDVMARQISKNGIIEANVLIEPPLSHIGGSKFHLVEECIEIGYNSTIEKMEEIKSVIEAKTT